MSIEQFSNTIKSKVYKDWFSKLEKNIVNTSAEALRSKEQAASKTSFYITKQTVQEMYRTITGKNIDDVDLQLFMRELAAPIQAPKASAAVTGKRIKVNGSDAIFFESIGFDTITTKLTSLLNSYPEVEDAYAKAENDFYDKSEKELVTSADYKKLSGAQKQKALDNLRKKAKERATFGYYFNKGHVISIATNLTKQFRDEISKADVLAKEQRKLLIEVLDRYIDKLQKDDLATANLPSTVDQELYAGYIKNSNKYLVEIQHRVANIEAGSASIPIVKELRNIFSASTEDIFSILDKSPALGSALLETPGSPSFKNLIVQDILNTLEGKPRSTKTYVQKPRLVATKKNKITKPPSNKDKIQRAKALKQKVQKVVAQKDNFKVEAEDPQLDLTSLTNFVNLHLQNVLSANMGDGSRRDILNYRTGRFAASAKVEYMSQSRAGMITAFYTYMKNPYATFSQGGEQEFPRTRDPKLLISQSIREIAAERVANRLRAVAV